jgi:PilZ domain
MLERRREPRRLILKTGTIRPPGDRNPIDCAIFDLSKGGACLVVPPETDVPETFELAIDPERRSRACRVRWQSSNKIGVAFHVPFET